MQSNTRNLNAENFPEKSTGERKWKITSYRMFHLPPVGGAGDTHLPSHVLHVSPAPPFSTPTLIANGQVRATSRSIFMTAVSSITVSGGSHCPARQDKLQLLLCANVTLEELILTVSTAKLCSVSQSGLF